MAPEKIFPGAKSRISICQLADKFQNNKLQIGFYKINGVKILLYDVCEPDYQFSVADYIDCARATINDIQKRGRLR